MLTSRTLLRAVAQTRAMCSNTPPPTKNDFEINPRFVNRNPRNLEQMLLARKPAGFEWDRGSREFWYRLEIELSKHFVRGKVFHNGGSGVVRASSCEWGVRQQLVSAVDRTAAFNIGRVLARRCLEAGILALHYDVPPVLKNSKRVESFLEGLKEEGIPLAEPDGLHELEDRPLATMYR